jgi:hypothetical protein
VADPTATQEATAGAASSSRLAAPRIEAGLTWALLAAVLAITGWRAAAAWRALPSFGSDFTHALEAGREIAAGRSPYRVHDFDYPPLVGFVAAPLSGLAPLTARRIWLSVNTVALMIAALACWRLAGRGVRGALVVLAVWCAAGTMPENLVLGQMNPVLLALLATAAAVAIERPAAAGGAIGLAAALKLWPGAVAPVLARGKSRSSITACATAVALGLVLPWAVAALLEGPDTPTSRGYWAGTPAPLNDSLPAAVLRWTLYRPSSAGPLPEAWTLGNQPGAFELDRAGAGLSLAVAGAALLGGLALLLAGRRNPSAEASPWAIAAGLSLAILASPISWYHYQLLQIPGVTLLLASSTGSRARTVARWVAALTLLAAMTSAHRWAFGAYAARWGWTGARPVTLLLATTVVPLLGAVLSAWLIAEARCRAR